MYTVYHSLENILSIVCTENIMLCKNELKEYIQAERSRLIDSHSYIIRYNYNQNICYILTSCVFLWENWQGPHENMMLFELLIQKMQRCDQNYNYIIYIAHDNTHACINTSYMCNNICVIYMCISSFPSQSH